MKKYYSIVLLVLLTICMSHPAMAVLNYFNDFESYPYLSLINGVDGWVSEGHQTGGWWVTNANYWQPPGESMGNSLNRDSAFSQYGEDYAVLHLFDEQKITYLSISMNYLLQPNESGSVEISGNNSNWIDITEELGIVARYSNAITWYATADLSHLLNTSGIQNDLYVRFMAWNPTMNGEWHVFAIDNLAILTPEPTTIVLLTLGGLVLRRNRK